MRHQGSKIFYASDKINAFVRMLDLFNSRISENHFSAFETLNSVSALKTAFKTKTTSNFSLDVKQE
jgi:hypothetical protein